MDEPFTERQTTRILWEETDPKAQERFEEGLRRYPYLKEAKYAHKKEQLYFMTLQGRSDRFLQRFFEEDLNIRSQDLDVLRSLALFVGEEACLQYFYKKEFRLAQAQTFLEEWFATKRFQRLPELEALVSERERLQKEAEEQIEYLLKERAYLQRQKEKEGAEPSSVSREAEEPFLKKREEQKERKRKRTGTLRRLFSLLFAPKGDGQKEKGAVQRSIRHPKAAHKPRLSSQPAAGFNPRRSKSASLKRTTADRGSKFVR